MNQPIYPNVEKHTDSPTLQAGTSGVSIYTRPVIGTSDPFILHGSCRFTSKEAEEIGPRVLASLVLCVLRDPLYAVRNPFEGYAFFVGDEQSKGDIRSAWFNLDIRQYVGTIYPGNYYITTSMGPWISDTIKVEVK